MNYKKEIYNYIWNAIVIKNFSVPESGGNIKVIPQGAIITLEPEDLTTKMTVNIPDSACVYSFYISSTIINPFLPFCVKDYDGKSKGPEELKAMEHKEPKLKSPGKLPANRHLQVKICKTEDEANRFMANRPDVDIVTVTPVAMGTNYYADIFFQVVYRTNL